MEELLRQIEVEVNAIRLAVKANDHESFWACVQDLHQAVGHMLDDRDAGEEDNE